MDPPDGYKRLIGLLKLTGNLTNVYHDVSVQGTKESEKNIHIFSTANQWPI